MVGFVHTLSSFFGWGLKQKPATALAIAGFRKFFSFICLNFPAHDAKRTGRMLPTSQATVDRSWHLNLFAERRVHFSGVNKPHLPLFVNGNLRPPHFRYCVIEGWC
jgi:hypothetical protein